MVDVWEVRGLALEHHQVDVEKAAAMATDTTTTSWIEVSAEDFERLGPMLDIHPRAIEDALRHADGTSAMAERTKLERFPHCELVYLFRAEVDATPRAGAPRGADHHPARRGDRR